MNRFIFVCRFQYFCQCLILSIETFAIFFKTLTLTIIVRLVILLRLLKKVAIANNFPMAPIFLAQDPERSQNEATFPRS